jgi:hypothetical protein
VAGFFENATGPASSTVRNDVETAWYRHTLHAGATTEVLPIYLSSAIRCSSYDVLNEMRHFYKSEELFAAVAYCLLRCVFGGRFDDVQRLYAFSPEYFTVAAKQPLVVNFPESFMAFRRLSNFELYSNLLTRQQKGGTLMSFCTLGVALGLLRCDPLIVDTAPTRIAKFLLAVDEGECFSPRQPGVTDLISTIRRLEGQYGEEVFWRLQPLLAHIFHDAPLPGGRPLTIPLWTDDNISVGRHTLGALLRANTIAFDSLSRILLQMTNMAEPVFITSLATICARHDDFSVVFTRNEKFKKRFEVLCYETCKGLRGLIKSTNDAVNAAVSEDDLQFLPIYRFHCQAVEDFVTVVAEDRLESMWNRAPESDRQDLKAKITTIKTFLLPALQKKIQDRISRIELEILRKDV